MKPHRQPTAIELVYPEISPDGRAKVIVLESGEAVGLCESCANRTIPNDPIATKVRQVQDHLRTDGPHD